jgi:hypothetical protein
VFRNFQRKKMRMLSSNLNSQVQSSKGMWISNHLVQEMQTMLLVSAPKIHLNTLPNAACDTPALEVSSRLCLLQEREYPLPV